MGSMDGSGHSVAVVAFSVAGAGLQLCEQLTQLGYVVERIDPRVTPSQARTGNARVAVCLFDGESITGDRQATLHALSKLASLPRVGLFTGASTQAKPELAFYCNEFLAWPAPIGALQASLRRLQAAADPGAVGERRRSNDLLHLNLIGESAAFAEAVHCLERFSRSDAPVLIEGETGTGKELAARAVHYLSARRGHPFVAVNCGALPDSLLENELFGHVRGAFTDAREPQTGLIAQADNGTLFLDEVMSLSPRGQVMLLRFLQEMEYRPLGSARTVRANVRVVAATNVSLQSLEGQGQFRSDLIYRLNIMHLRLPALRERAEDVLLLAEHFLAGLRRRYGQAEKFLHEEFVAWMRQYHWPGNVRELEHLLHREFLLSEHAAIRGPGPRLPVHEREGGRFTQAKALAIQTFERDYLSRLMAESDGNVTLAARRAGKERRTFGKLLKKHGLSRSL